MPTIDHFPTGVIPIPNKDGLTGTSTIEMVNHPAHYGGADNPYEVIKVIEAWDLGFNLSTVLRYLGRLGKKDEAIQELEKAAWYLNREIQNRKKMK